MGKTEIAPIGEMERIERSYLLEQGLQETQVEREESVKEGYRDRSYSL